MAETLGRYAVAVAARFSEGTGFKFSTIGMKAIGDGRFFVRLQAGDFSGYTLRRLDEAMAWMKEGWPAGVKWPPAPAWPYQGPGRRSTNGTKEKVQRAEGKEKRKASGRRAKGERSPQRTTADVG